MNERQRLAWGCPLNFEKLAKNPATWNNLVFEKFAHYDQVDGDTVKTLLTVDYYFRKVWEVYWHVSVSIGKKRGFGSYQPRSIHDSRDDIEFLLTKARRELEAVGDKELLYGQGGFISMDEVLSVGGVDASNFRRTHKRLTGSDEMRSVQLLKTLTEDELKGLRKPEDCTE